MTDEQIEQLLRQNEKEIFVEFYSPKEELRYEQLKGENILAYISRLKSAKQTAETQLRELLSALYRQTDNKDKSFTLYQSDVVELANDYGIKEEELK